MQERRENIVYFNINRYFKNIIFSIFLFCICYYLDSITCFTSVPLNSIMYCIISLVVITVCSTANKINHSKIVSKIIIIYSFFAMEHFLTIISMSDFKIYKQLQYSNSFKGSFLLVLITTLYYFIGKSIEEKKVTNELFFFTILIITITGGFLISYLGEKVCIVFLNIMILYLNYNGKGAYKRDTLIKNDGINGALILHRIIYIIPIFNIMNLILFSNEYKIQFIVGIVYFIIFITESMQIIDKTMNLPYREVFKNLHKSNGEIIELNKKIIRQNSKLQNSQLEKMKKENLIDSFFVNIPIPLVIINKETERISFANKSFVELIDKQRIKEVINKKVFSLITCEEVGFIKEKQALIRGEVKVGEVIKYLDIEILDEDENNDQVIILFSDVTEKIKTEKIEESIKNKKFEAKLKKDFLSNISHDLKTPINVIYSATQLMDVFIKDEMYDEVNKYIEISRKNCYSLIKFTNNLIDKSKIISDCLNVKLVVTNIVEIIEEVVMSLVEYAKSKEISIIFDTDEEELYAEIDIDFIQRITLNIISNSIKFCDKLGKITVELRDLGDEIKIVFKDDGIGMDKDILNSAFNRYTMGENNEFTPEKGTGVGLYVVKKLVDEQGGKINIYSELKKGTEIEIIFKKVKVYE